MKDRDGRAAYNFFMNMRAATRMEAVAVVHRNPLAEMLAQIEREIQG